MKKFFGQIALAAALAVSVSSVAAQDAGGVVRDRQVKAPAEPVAAGKTAAKAEKKVGTDCSPQRAGVRCSRPKPRKPWFFGD